MGVFALPYLLTAIGANAVATASGISLFGLALAAGTALDWGCAVALSWMVLFPPESWTCLFANDDAIPSRRRGGAPRRLTFSGGGAGVSNFILSFGRKVRRRWRCLSLVAVMLPAIAGAAPQSLRSESDLNDVADAFMRDMVGGQVGSAYRGLARYWPLMGPQLSKLVADATVERRALRKTLGLSLGSEPVGMERVGERVVRLTRLERFDDGALVWRFIFYRPNTAWQLVDVESSSDLRTLFGEASRQQGAGASRGERMGDLLQREAEPPSVLKPAAETETEKPTGGADDAGSGYEIDIDGRL